MSWPLETSSNEIPFDPFVATERAHMTVVNKLVSDLAGLRDLKKKVESSLTFTSSHHVVCQNQRQVDAKILDFSHLD